jgi:hypothetical protein
MQRDRDAAAGLLVKVQDRRLHDAQLQHIDVAICESLSLL